MNWKIEPFLVLMVLTAVGCSTKTSEERTAQVVVAHELEYASTRYLIEAEQLKKQLSRANDLKLIDFRKGDQFTSGHIKGAVNIWRPDITDTTYAYGGMMPTKVQLEDLLGELGISPEDTIIIYDDRAAANAARLWWILKFYGHENMAILNGGMKAWSAQGGELSTDTFTLIQVDHEFQHSPELSIYADLKAVEQSISDTEVLLLDNRSPEEYNGELQKDGEAYSGAIPGALHLNFELAVDYNNQDLFHSADSLVKIFNGIGVDGSKRIITYCRSGVRSAHTLFVLSELLGYGHVSNYDGSWIEWSYLNAHSP